MTTVLADPPPITNTWAAPALATVVALVLAAVVFAIVRSVRGRTRTPDDFLLAGRNVGALPNAVTMVGGIILYSTVIISIGHIALNGLDAIYLVVAFTIGSVLGVLIYAAPLRNVGGYTLGDLFVLRARERPARIASAATTLVVFTMFMVVMLAAVGLVANRMFNTSSTVNKPFVAGVMFLVGLIVIAWVYMGGMAGVTRILVFKTILMVLAVAVLTVAVMAKYKMNMVHLLNDAQDHAPPNKSGAKLLEDGRLFSKGTTYNSGQDPWVHLSKLVCIAIGGMGMPWFFMRFHVARNGREARQSAGWASMITAAFFQCIIILGLGAVAILHAKNVQVVPEHRDATLPKLVDNLFGKWANGVLGGFALLSVAAILAAVLINGVTSFTKDINAARGRNPEPAAEVKDIRRNVLVIGFASLVLGTAMAPLLTHIFIPTSIDLGASVVLPSLLYSLYWRRFNTRGLMWTVYGGMVATLVMVVFSNGISGDPHNAMFAGLDFKIIDLEPGMISAPIGFLLGYLGTVTSRERNDAGFAEMRVRALTGAVIPAPKAPLARSADTGEPESRTPSEAH
ncbi:solute symporter family protein [Actinacidiphila paucisporea]|uniref:Cation/acetate symporter n=1 Tax=Actinacidiphila paucisporea TaxID=310782 RepID=A0A1M7Q7E2_9ACTN|nr:Na+:solute symporter [Actinacidiphila paucisporea]SHN26477.1 cation/acetate symporter [Actinacidiphila paucisporea]